MPNKILTAAVSLSLKNPALAKKIGDGHLKIFTPSGSYIYATKHAD